MIKMRTPAISATMGWICAAVMCIEKTSADAICESQKLYPPRRLHDSEPCNFGGFHCICGLAADRPGNANLHGERWQAG
jgi:hypothetical protein